ncbi:MAG TPA: HAMP domain-containing sensor histidine kinase [Tahibacter sp.]|nr:HAMP domain-containing sensor histidine kinase [Tahibacter sp.]
MTLSDFLRQASDDIVACAVEFARTMPGPANEGIDVQVLGNHLPLALDVIALDLEQPQSRQQSITKAEGRAVPKPGETAVQTHGRMRADVGLTVSQVIAEYRVLRAVVVRLWSEAGGLGSADAVADLIRFNEAIDQAIAGSVAFHGSEVERWRNTLLAVIGHDLRTPLSTVVYATETLAILLRGSPLLAQVELVQRGTTRLTALLDSLLEYNNAMPGTAMTIAPMPVDLGQSCRAEVELLRSAFPDVTLHFEMTGSLFGRFDENRVREALANLVSNAVQYRTPDTPVQVAAGGHGDHLTLTVCNDGEAIPPELLESFFAPLRRRDTSGRHGKRRNLGIGLFIVREIAHAHGGEVTADCADGNIRFEIRIPKRMS